MRLDGDSDTVVWPMISKTAGGGVGGLEKGCSKPYTETFFALLSSCPAVCFLPKSLAWDLNDKLIYNSSTKLEMAINVFWYAIC